MRHFVFCLLLTMVLVPSLPANPDNGPKLTSAKYYATEDGDQIYFGLEIAKDRASFTLNDMDAAVQSDIDFSCGTAKTHVWDNRRYWHTLQPDTKAILYYYNESRDTFGWVAVQHNGNGWEYLLSNGDSGGLKEGDDFKVGWESGGSRVVFTVGVPNGNSGWKDGEYTYQIGW